MSTQLHQTDIRLIATPLQDGACVTETDAYEVPRQADANKLYKVAALRHTDCRAMLQTCDTYSRDTEGSEKQVGGLGWDPPEPVIFLSCAR